MEARDHRKNIRARRNFPVRLFMEDLNLSIEGITTNLSRDGAFIKSKNRHFCQAGALAELTLFLPPDFTGQNKTIALQGDAVITRIDQEKEGVAVGFVNALRAFERIDLPDSQAKIE